VNRRFVEIRKRSPVRRVTSASHMPGHEGLPGTWTVVLTCGHERRIGVRLMGSRLMGRAPTAVKCYICGEALYEQGKGIGNAHNN